MDIGRISEWEVVLFCEQRSLIVFTCLLYTSPSPRDEGDNDGAVDIFIAIAEFEKPKLARVESKVEEVKTDDLTDEELAELLKKAAKDA